MKKKVTDLCHIDASMFLSAHYPPAVRSFIQDAYAQILVKALDFISDTAEAGVLDYDHLDVVEGFFDGHHGEVVATVSVDLNLKFDLVNKRRRITEVDFGG